MSDRSLRRVFPAFMQ